MREHSAVEPVTYSVVIPVYGNEGTIETLVRALEQLASELDAPMEAVFVVDGSPDDSLGLLRALLPTSSLRSQLIVHSRNFGSFPAIRTGLAAARGEYLGVMAADLQEPPRLMAEFFDRLASGRFDVAVGRRAGRADPTSSSVASNMFWGLYRRAINPEIPVGGVDVFGCTRRVARELIALDESGSSLVALLYWVGFRRVEVPYVRRERTIGKSGWTFRKKFRYLLDSVFSFTDIPIWLLGVVGGFGVLVTLVIALVVFVTWLQGGIDYPGYTPLMLVILFSTFLLLFGLGIVGAYVHRAFENTKHRPVAISMTAEVFDGEQ